MKRTLLRGTIIALGLLFLVYPLHKNEVRAQSSSNADTLRSLVPEKLQGRTRGEIRTGSRRRTLGLETKYRSQEEKGAPISLALTYGNRNQRDLLRTVEKQQSWKQASPINGYHGYDHYDQQKKQVQVALFVGRILVSGKIEAQDDSLNPEAAREKIRRLLGALDLKTLEEFDLSSKKSPFAINVPKGFAPHLFWDMGEKQIAFVHPPEWSVMERRFGAVAMRDSTAASKVDEQDIQVSTEKKLRLLTPENVVVSFSMIGNADADHKEFVESAIEASPLKQAEVVKTPTEVWNGYATEAEVQGTDADGHSVTWHLIVTNAGEQKLFQISVLRPTDLSEEVMEQISQMIDPHSSTFSYTPEP